MYPHMFAVRRNEAGYGNRQEGLWDDCQRRKRPRRGEHRTLSLALSNL